MLGMFFVRLWRSTMCPFWLLVVMAMDLSRGLDINLYSYFCRHSLQVLSKQEFINMLLIHVTSNN
jgi:hypothetical protein